MGRKKKIENNEIEIKTKPESTITYSGGATIKIIKNGKVRRTIQQHNAGSNYLFEFICNCIAGNFYENRRPQILRVGNLNSDTYTDYSLAYVIASTSRAYLKSNEEVVDVSFNFPGTLINVSAVDDSKPLNCLRIYSKSNNNNVENWSAQIVLTGDDVIESLTKDESLLVIWEMKITNTQGGNN